MTRLDRVLKLLDKYDGLAMDALSLQGCEAYGTFGYDVLVSLRKEKAQLAQELIEHGCREEELMNNELTKITLTFPIRCDRPNRNGHIFTEEAIKHAFANSNPHIPIIMEDGVSRDRKFMFLDDRVVGCTDPTYYFDYDDENKVCEVTLTGRLFDVAPTIIINEMNDGIITDFEIKSVSIVK